MTTASNIAELLPAPPASAALDALLDALRRRHGACVNAVLLYGSCLRSGDLYDGLVDLYLIVDRYRDIYPSRRKAFANWLLPPNVFYIELPVDDRTVRAKYAVLSDRDLRRGTPASGSVQALWQQGLQLSYGAELRAERSGRAGELTGFGADYYQAATRLLAGSLRYGLTLRDEADGLHYQADIPAARRLASRLTWPLRKAPWTCATARCRKWPSWAMNTVTAWIVRMAW